MLDSFQDEKDGANGRIVIDNSIERFVQCWIRLKRWRMLEGGMVVGKWKEEFVQCWKL